MSKEPNDSPKSLIKTGTQLLSERSTDLVKRGLASLIARENRVIYFPFRRFIGYLNVFADSVTAYEVMENEWIERYPANGTVTVRKNAKLMLEIDEWYVKSIDLKRLIKEVDGIDDISYTGLLPFGYFEHFSHLRWLKLTDKFLPHGEPWNLVEMAELTQLQALDLSGTKIERGSLAHLQNFNQLDFLNLCDTGIDDCELRFLKNLNQLQWLCLDCNPYITDTGLSYLLALTQLKMLCLVGTSINGEKTASFLERSLPQCTVWWQ